MQNIEYVDILKKLVAFFSDLENTDSLYRTPDEIVSKAIYYYTIMYLWLNLLTETLHVTNVRPT